MPDRTTRSFRVQGGRCWVTPRDDDGLRVDQSPLRHLHPVHAVASGALLALAAYSAVTGWTYDAPVRDVGWPLLLAVGAWVPLVRAGGLLLARRRGFTGADHVPHEAVTEVRLDVRSERWYLKQRRTVPAFVVHYRSGGTTRKRLLRLPLRWTDGDLHRAVRAFEDAGYGLSVSAAARELLDEAALEGHRVR